MLSVGTDDGIGRDAANDYAGWFVCAGDPETIQEVMIRHPRCPSSPPDLPSCFMQNRHTTQGAFQDAEEGVSAISQDTVRRQSRGDVCIKSNQASQLFDLVDRLFSFVWLSHSSSASTIRVPSLTSSSVARSCIVRIVALFVPRSTSPI